MPKSIWPIISAIAEAVLACATVAAVILGWHQLVDVVNARRAQNYLELRKVFLQMDKELDIVDRRLVYPEDGACMQWHALKRYWYFSQSEWTIARIDPSEHDNWEETQLPQILRSLTRPAYRKALIDMNATRFNNPNGREFIAEITNGFKKAYPQDVLLDPGKGFIAAAPCTQPLESASKS
jgi:hypothetical protein